nr:retrovirus-related Pol polyprotein from transposon TNT 1-94 [Tanacetum cinerariifolium]
MVRERLLSRLWLINCYKWYQEPGFTGAAGYRHVKVLEFFDCPSPRQGVEDLKELLHKESMKKNVFGLRWNCRELKGIIKLRFFSDWIHKAYRYAGFFGWLASIKQGMLEPVMVKCIFLGYHKNIVGNKLWRLDDATSKVVLYRNMGFNESEKYKKTFIGSSVGTGSMQVLYGFEFEVEPLGDHTFEVKPQENVDQGAGLQEVQTQDLIYYHLARDREQHLASTVAGNAVTTTMAINESIHKAWKKKMWLKGLLTESRYELRLVAGIATGALVKGGSRSEVSAQVEVAAYRYGLKLILRWKLLDIVFILVNREIPSALLFCQSINCCVAQHMFMMKAMELALTPTNEVDVFEMAPTSILPNVLGYLSWAIGLDVPSLDLLLREDVEEFDCQVDREWFDP